MLFIIERLGREFLEKVDNKKETHQLLYCKCESFSPNQQLIEDFSSLGHGTFLTAHVADLSTLPYHTHKLAAAHNAAVQSFTSLSQFEPKPCACTRISDTEFN